MTSEAEDTTRSARCAGAEATDLLARAEPRRIALPGRGVELALLDWGGSGPILLMQHANGFSKASWARVAVELADEFRPVAMDARGHGDSSRPEGARAYAWAEFALDVVAVAEILVEEGGRPVAVGVGHSFGGTSTLGAAARRPGLFERLVLVDPVVPPPHTGPERSAHVADLVDNAVRRRSHFDSRAEARAWFAERSLFADWQPEALDLYVLDALGDCPAGGVQLKCPGEVEGAVFANGGGVDTAALAAGLETPALWLHAARGNFPLALYEQLAASMLHGRVETLDVGHLIPMERPDLVVGAIRRFAAEPV